MPRVHIEWRSSSKENYINFCKKNPNIIITFNEWKNNWSRHRAISYFIKSKNPQQCRSYSIKLMNTFKSIKKFIEKGE